MGLAAPIPGCMLIIHVGELQLKGDADIFHGYRVSSLIYNLRTGVIFHSG